MASHQNGSTSNKCMKTPHRVDSSHLSETLHSIDERRTITHKILLDGEHLSIAQVHAVGEISHLEVSLSNSSLEEMERNSTYLMNKISSGLVVYGVNTGFGGSADVRCEDSAIIQTSLIRHLNAGFGEVFDVSVSRGVMLIRANSLARAFSGVRLDVPSLLCAMIKADIVPIVPKRGSISASGDLMPSSYITAAMMGRQDCKVLHAGKVKFADEALQAVKLQPITFINKEALAVLNSSSFADCLGSQVLYAANTAALLTQLTVAMSVEALNGKLESFHPTIHKCMPHVHQIEVAKNVRKLLEDSKLAVSKLDMDLKDDGLLKQDRYALRTAAQWLGPAVDELRRATATCIINLNSTNDNPVVDHREGIILHGGNFQGTAMAVAMDNARQALQLCGKLLFAQMSELVNMDLNRGLPPNLSGSDYRNDFGFKGTETAMASYMSELNLLTSPVTRHTLSAEMNNQSVNSLALLSARWTEQALTVLHQMLANITVCQVQAIDLRWLKGQVTSLLTGQGANHSDLGSHTVHWYDFAFTPTGATKVLFDSKPHLNSPDFVKCVSSEIGGLMEDVYAGRHVKRVAASLGQGTRKMYLYVREQLEIHFYHGERCLDSDLQKMFDAIMNHNIEMPLVNIFKAD